MIDIRQLPDAWETVYKIGGEEGSECDELYDIYYKISTAIFKYRVKHDLSQKKLAQMLGVTQSMVSKLESGDYNYTIEQLWKVSQKLGFKFNVVFEEEDEDYTTYSDEEASQDSVDKYPSMAVG